MYINMPDFVNTKHNSLVYTQSHPFSSWAAAATVKVVASVSMLLLFFSSSLFLLSVTLFRSFASKKRANDVIFKVATTAAVEFIYIYSYSNVFQAFNVLENHCLYC